MNHLLWLEQWLRTAADGTWERTHHLRIESTDAPGWHVFIDLNGTPVCPAGSFVLRHMQAGGADWMDCRVVDGVFLGSGGVLMLGPILQVFRDWVSTL